MGIDTSATSLNRGSAPVVVIAPPPRSLDVQILEAENAVLQRDRKVRDSLLAVGMKARSSATRAAVGIAVGGGALALVWLLTRHRAAPAASAVAPKVRRRASLALVRAAAFLWPLLPESMKSRASNLVVRSVLKTPLLNRGEPRGEPRRSVR